MLSEYKNSWDNLDYIEILLSWLQNNRSKVMFRLLLHRIMIYKFYTPQKVVMSLELSNFNSLGLLVLDTVE